MLSKKVIAIVTPAAAAGSPKLTMKNRLVARAPLARMFALLLLWPEIVLAGAPPAIQPTAAFQHQSVALGNNFTFTVSVTGDPPLAFQWRLAATDLSGRYKPSHRDNQRPTER